MSGEGQLQVWWHRNDGKRDKPESQSVSGPMAARAVAIAARGAGYHAVRIMQKRRGRWLLWKDPDA